MKTKALILTAILTVAGTAGLMAQSSNVYSQNIVGYVSQTFPAGFSMVANQLNGSPDNKVTTVMPTPAQNTAVFKFKVTGGYTINTFADGAWDGDDLNMTLGPGEGVWVSAQTPFTNTFVGEVKLNSTNAINQGYNIYSSPIPQGGLLQTDLKFTPAQNDTIFQRKATGGYKQNSFADGAWDGDDNGNEPTIAVGESFWIQSQTASHTPWVRSFVVGP